MAIWEALVDGEKKRLDDDGTLYLLQVFGVGLPPARRLKVRSPQQHGATDIGFRYDEREMRLGFFFNAGDPVGALDKRDELYDFWKSLEATPIQLRYTRDDNSVRQIDCHVTGVVDMPYDPNENQMGNQSFVIQVEAADPMWYDPVAEEVTFAEDDSGWWMALGTIDEANVLEHVEEPTQGQAITADVEDTEAWTLYFRTDISTLTVVATEVIVRKKGNPSALTWRAALDPGEYSFVDDELGGRYATGFLQTGEHDYIVITNTPPSGGQAVYRDGTIVGFYPGSPQGIKSGVAGSAWRASNTSGDDAWTPELSYTAIFNISLSSTQRTSLAAAVSLAAAGVYYAAKTVTYGGSFLAYPIITITGPITDPVLTNVSTGEELDFTGVTIAGGDTYTIDCRFGYKTVKNAAGTNKIAELTAASDLATFHLGADPEVSGGANAFTLTGSGTDANTEVTVTYYERFVGA